MTGGAEHHLGPRGAPAIRVAGRVVLLVRLALHYPADQQLAVLEPPNQEPPQEFGPHLGRGALVERSPERAKGPGQARPFRRNFRSLVSGHVAFIKPSGRFRGKALMRVVLDSVTTPEDQKISLSSTLEDSKGGVCGNSPKDDEGTIQGCGKSKKVAAKDAALGGAIGAGAGATVGLGHEIDCAYYGNCGGPGLGTDVLAGAALGAGTALLFNLFEHEKEIILIQGSELNFVVNRTLDGAATGPASTTKKQ